MAKKATPAESSETALVQFKQAYPALLGGGAVAEALAVNLGGEEVGVFDLERIRIPSGGALAWEVAGADGTPEYPKEVEGIIVYSKVGRSFWRKTLKDSGSGSPPDCSSPDGVRGYGDPGLICRECPYAEFGSRNALDAVDMPKGTVAGPGAQAGRGPQACKQQRFVFLLRQDKSLPTVITLPPTSMKAMKQWLLQISTGVNPRPYWCFLVKLTLVKAKNSAGIEYAQVRLQVMRELTGEEIAAVQEFAVTTRQTFSQYRDGQSAKSVEEEDDLGGEDFEEEETA